MRPLSAFLSPEAITPSTRSKDSPLSPLLTVERATTPPRIAKLHETDSFSSSANDGRYLPLPNLYLQETSSYCLAQVKARRRARTQIQPNCRLTPASKEFTCWKIDNTTAVFAHWKEPEKGTNFLNVLDRAEVTRMAALHLSIGS